MGGLIDKSAMSGLHKLSSHGARIGRRRREETMRLSAAEIAIERGGRQIFRTSRSRRRRGSADRRRAERGGQVEPAARHRRLLELAAGGSRSKAATRAHDRRAGALSRPRRRAEGRAYGGREPRLLGRRARRRRARGVAAGAWRGSASPMSPISRFARCRPARSAASRSRDFSSRARPIWLIDEPTTALDVAAQRLFAGVMREHCERRPHRRRDPRRRSASTARRDLTARRGSGDGRAA